MRDFSSQTWMGRAIFYAALVASCILTALLDVEIAKTTGFDMFTFTYFLVVPLGAVMVGITACGGAIGTSYLLHVRPTGIDAVAMVAAGLACILLIEVLTYWTYVLPDGRHASDLVGFWRFVDVSTRSAHYRVGRSLQNDLGAVGAYGYVMLGIQVVAFLVGGFSAFAIVKQLPACDACPSYLRKVRQTSNGEMPVGQADQLLGLMKGSFEDVHNVVAWRTPPTGLGKRDKRALITCRLYECPRCKLEVVTATTQVHDGKAWKEVPKATVRRNLGADTTLWTAFK